MINCLVVGNAESANLINKLDLTKYKEIIIVNKGFLKLDGIATQHVIGEKVTKSTGYDAIKLLNSAEYKEATPRYINHKGSGCFDLNKKYNLKRLQRQNILNFDPKKFLPCSLPNTFSLFAGPRDKETGLALGTSLLQSIHLASILGATRIDIIGADLYFKHPDRDHFYGEGKSYRDKLLIKKENAPDTLVLEDGKETTNYFYNSAVWLNENLNNAFPHIIFKDYSEGLLKF